MSLDPGVEQSVEPAAPVGKRRKLLIAAAVVGVVALILGTAALGGTGAPAADTYPDSDGDGMQDRFDAEPHDPTWASMDPRPVTEADYVEVTEQELARIISNPDAHVDDTIIIYTSVEELGTDVFRGFASHAPQYSSALLGDNAMFTGAGSVIAPVAEGDTIKVRASVVGSTTYESVAGPRTVPLFYVAAVEVIGEAAEQPAPAPTWTPAPAPESMLDYEASTSALQTAWDMYTQDAREDACAQDFYQDIEGFDDLYDDQAVADFKAQVC